MHRPLPDYCSKRKNELKLFMQTRAQHMPPHANNFREIVFRCGNPPAGGQCALVSAWSTVCVETADDLGCCYGRSTPAVALFIFHSPNEQPQVRMSYSDRAIPTIVESYRHDRDKYNVESYNERKSKSNHKVVALLLYYNAGAGRFSCAWNVPYVTHHNFEVDYPP